jgi:hypothetical protein
MSHEDVLYEQDGENEPQEETTPPESLDSSSLTSSERQEDSSLHTVGSSAPHSSAPSEVDSPTCHRSVSMDYSRLSPFPSPDQLTRSITN